MRSCYVTHTKIITLGDKLFDEKIGYSDSFRTLFHNTHCLSQYLREIRIKKCPRIKDLGYVFLNKDNVKAAHTSYNKEDCSLYVENDYSEDERLRYFYFELRKPVSLLAFQDGIKAKGKIFVHFYPFGCIAIVAALSLRGIKDLPEKELRQTALGTTPGKSRLKWTWRCKWGDIPLNDVICKVEERIADSLLIPGANASLDSGGDWRTTFSFSAVNAEKCDARNLVTDNYTYAGNKLADKSVRSTFSLDNVDHRQHPFRTFWRINRIHELVLVKKNLYDVYIHFFKTEILRLRNQRMGTLKEKFSNDFWKKITVYQNDLAAFISYTDDIILSSSSRYRHYYAVISDIHNLNKQRERLISLQKEWIDECSQFKNPVLNAVMQIIPFLGK